MNDAPTTSPDTGGEDREIMARWLHSEFGRITQHWPRMEGAEREAWLKRADRAIALATPTPRKAEGVLVPRDLLSEAIKRLTVMRDQARDGTPVTDPNEWEADELTEIIAMLAAAPTAEVK